MKRFVAMGLAIFFVLPMLTTTLVFAHEGEEADATTLAQTDDKEAKREALRARLEKRKADLKIKLTFAEEARLKLRCKASQGLINRVKGRINGIKTSRTQVYGNIASHLEKLVSKLQANGIDTVELETAVNDLKTKIETFSTDLATYEQAVSDLVELDCQADPEAFKASLETARAALEKVKTDASEVRKQLKDVIKPLLVEIRSQVEAKKKDNEGGE